MKTLFVFLFILIPLHLLAPGERWMPLAHSEGLNPFKNVFLAVCLVESSGNPLAYNPAEGSVGIAQIRQCRVDDYNKRTGSNVRLEDCYDLGVSRRIFMFYSSQYGPYQMDLIIRRWNGNGPATYNYLEKVKAKL